MWGTWTQHLTSMLKVWGTQSLTLTDHVVLGEQLLPWLQTHDVHSQQDAAEFAGWLRGQLFEQFQIGSLQAGWQKRLMHSIEDQGKVLVPILLSCSQKSNLQDLIDDWHLNDPFVCAFVQANDITYIQVNRFPILITNFVNRSMEVGLRYSYPSSTRHRTLMSPGIAIVSPPQCFPKVRCPRVGTM